MLWISVLIIASSMTQIQGEYGSFCWTPDKKPGTCIPALSCKPTYDLFQKSHQGNVSISDSEIEKIQKLHCGMFRNVPYICCEESNIQLNPEGLSILKKQDCGYITRSLVDSHEARLSKYPWTALLIYDDAKDRYKCGGSLITEQYVLTAAHCVIYSKPRLLKVRLGEHNISTDPDCIGMKQPKICAPSIVDVDVADTIVHPNYRLDYNDIALIRLERKVERQVHIKTICLPIYDDLRNKDHDEYIVSGWGKTEYGTYSDVLRAAVLSSVDERLCEDQFKHFGYTLNLRRSQICVVAKDLSQSCTGDSGGPMGFADVYNGRPRFVQYGIVVSGPTYCDVLNLPSVYTNVSYNIQWITDHIQY